MTQALRAQTLDRSVWEWILVDDLHQVRQSAVARHIGDSIQFQHLPPREIKPYSATGIAINTGLAAARGELVYFMADYMYPHPTCLERHWEIYAKFGPKVLISGPLIDEITFFGKSIWGQDWETFSEPEKRMVKVGDRSLVYKEHLPSFKVPMKLEWEYPTVDNLISIWAEPFSPHWPAAPGIDWRMGAISPNLYRGSDVRVHLNDPNWWWGGRNDSGPLKLLIEAGGLEETGDGRHGGLETEWVERMLALGAIYLVDQRAPCLLLPHPTRKRETVNP
jgi:glycosyltransferase involved in cell wall biosynthesis